MVDRDVLAIGDSRRGHHVIVQWEGWRNKRPAQLADRDGRRWTVRQVLDHWPSLDHGNRERKIAYGVEAQRWRLISSSPVRSRTPRTRPASSVSRCGCPSLHHVNSHRIYRSHEVSPQRSMAWRRPPLFVDETDGVRELAATGHKRRVALVARRGEHEVTRTAEMCNQGVGGRLGGKNS
jgi:hypothetical protein